MDRVEGARIVNSSAVARLHCRLPLNFLAAPDKQLATTRLSLPPGFS